MIVKAMVSDEMDVLSGVLQRLVLGSSYVYDWDAVNN